MVLSWTLMDCLLPRGLVLKWGEKWKGWRLGIAVALLHHLMQRELSQKAKLSIFPTLTYCMVMKDGSWPKEHVPSYKRTKWVCSRGWLTYPTWDLRDTRQTQDQVVWLYLHAGLGMSLNHPVGAGSFGQGKGSMEPCSGTATSPTALQING